MKRRIRAENPSAARMQALGATVSINRIMIPDCDIGTSKHTSKVPGDCSIQNQEDISI